MDKAKLIRDKAFEESHAPTGWLGSSKSLMTAEEFWHSPENGKRRELVAGEVVVSMPPGGM